jgi:serine/threonine-protein kinase
VEETPPPVEETPPPVEETPPPVEETPPPVEETPPPVEETPTNTSSVTSVPIIVLGTEKNTIINTLGNPTSINKGYWPNSEAILYQDYVPNELDLGYLVHTTTGKLRQSEASFASNTDIRVIENTLTGLLQGNMSSDIQEALKEVYNRQTDLRSFNLGNVKGAIQRNSLDRLYIAVWEADFH